MISVIIRDIRLKSYHFLFFRRFVRTRSGAPPLSMWKFLDLKIQQMTTIFKKNVHLMHNSILIRCVPLEKFYAVI